jgi:hypothetical protein
MGTPSKHGKNAKFDNLKMFVYILFFKKSPDRVFDLKILAGKLWFSHTL